MAPPKSLSAVALLSAGFAFSLVAGCANRPTPPPKAPPTDQAAAGTFKIIRPGAMTDAALQPFADIGLKQAKIPPILKAIKTPYAAAPHECELLGAAILDLDLALGQDVDVRLADKTLKQKGADAAGDALVDAIESTSTSVIPFRGLVREVSGASGRERRAAAAVQAGRLRRAYLKGIGQALGCQPPAAPLPYKE